MIGYRISKLLFNLVIVAQGRKLRFSQSQSKHRLFVGNIPKAWEKEELEKVLGEQGPGIQSVELLKVQFRLPLHTIQHFLLYNCSGCSTLYESVL